MFIATRPATASPKILSRLLRPESEWSKLKWSAGNLSPRNVQPDAEPCHTLQWHYTPAGFWSEKCMPKLYSYRTCINATTPVTSHCTSARSSPWQQWIDGAASQCEGGWNEHVKTMRWWRHPVMRGSAWRTNCQVTSSCYHWRSGCIHIDTRFALVYRSCFCAWGSCFKQPTRVSNKA